MNRFNKNGRSLYVAWTRTLHAGFYTSVQEPRGVSKLRSELEMKCQVVCAPTQCNLVAHFETHFPYRVFQPKVPFYAPAPPPPAPCAPGQVSRQAPPPHGPRRPSRRRHCTAPRDPSSRSSHTFTGSGCLSILYTELSIQACFTTTYGAL